MCSVKFAATYSALTDNIIDREGTGPCPMEETVLNITDPVAAISALKEKLKSLR